MKQFVILSAVLSVCLCQQPPSPPQPVEPLCKAKNCGNNDCRVVQRCTGSDPSRTCTLEAICIPAAQSEFMSGGCEFAGPLLEYSASGQLELASCYNNHPCPSGFYCSTKLQDVATRCCRSDSVSPPNSGTCPVMEPAEYFCVEECLTDADCYIDGKCCERACDIGGTARTCTMPVTVQPPTPPQPQIPQTTNPCALTLCSSGTKCVVSSNGQAVCVPDQSSQTPPPPPGFQQPPTPQLGCPSPYGPYSRWECSLRNQCSWPGNTCPPGTVCCATVHCGHICRYPVIY